MAGANLLSRFDPCKGGVDVDAAMDGGVRRFFEAWHAQAFATTIALSRAGLFTWAAWVEIFSGEIRANPQRETESTDEAYYRQWLKTLETIVIASGRVGSEEISEALEHWRRSFIATPHGKPIVFRRDLPDLPDIDDHPDHHYHDYHNHHHDGYNEDRENLAKPIAVSPAVAP
jgi:nitrile hydratase accessory protein